MAAHRSTAGSVWLTAVQVARQVLSVVSVSVLARRIPAATYGLVGMDMLVPTLFGNATRPEHRSSTDERTGAQG